MSEVLLPFGKKLQLKLPQYARKLERMKPMVKQLYEWFSHFRRGEMCVEDQLSCVRPSASRNDKTVEKVCQAVLVDRNWTMNKIYERKGVC
jgi:hypothetical protein